VFVQRNITEETPPMYIAEQFRSKQSPIASFAIFALLARKG
jgi:hypothetical protein